MVALTAGKQVTVHVLVFFPGALGGVEVIAAGIHAVVEEHLVKDEELVFRAPKGAIGDAGFTHVRFSAADEFARIVDEVLLGIRLVDVRNER